MKARLTPLSERYDVVVANPPYMGSSSLGKWMSKWVKDQYPEGYRDLCTSFIDRGFSLSRDDGYSAMVTMQSWMFLGSFEKLRGKILRNHAISSMAHLGTRAFGQIAGEVVSTTATVFTNAKCDAKGTYLRLVDMGSEIEKKEGALEALANPDCGWFFRRSANDFEVIQGSPIAYWASQSIREVFKSQKPFDESMSFREGIHTANNERFLKLWWEPSNSLIVGNAASLDDIDHLGKWIPYCKGGQFRKWYGNFDYVIGFNSPMREEMKSLQGCVWPSQSLWFKEGGTWTAISTGCLGVRYYPKGCLFDAGGQVLVGDNCVEAIAALNSSLYAQIAELTMPTLNYKCGMLKTLPDIRTGNTEVVSLANENISICQTDWNSFENSWDYAKHPLL